MAPGVRWRRFYPPSGIRLVTSAATCEPAYQLSRSAVLCPHLFFNAVGSCAFDKSKNVTAFSFGNLKSIQRGPQMAEE